jgi:hypothetical protein
MTCAKGQTAKIFNDINNLTAILQAGSKGKCGKGGLPEGKNYLASRPVSCGKRLF